ncbi:hypothetical protein AMAG_19950 [Allomyces macrogynus ATCC 38327]|uniref:Uncharacterized protein n=1 Tax=Allomyces macrogynus (strain ATCC 38327) TaxID=578462 RepID=A0A0L0T2T7_ALLM3|nr:hypothetical protein AMAG_19950 [Allomyces macrogynus ATCC 38327]|eukprot:KNE69046.1 hypothetical protein AMAG_19950 [Allomyces macrogynus ATCC 38327]
MGQLLMSVATVVDAGPATRDTPAPSRHLENPDQPAIYNAPRPAPRCPGHIAAIIGVLVALLALKVYYTIKRRRQRQQRHRVYHQPPPDTSTPHPRTKDAPTPTQSPVPSGPAASRAGSALSPDTTEPAMRVPVSPWLFRYNDYTGKGRIGEGWTKWTAARW